MLTADQIRTRYFDFYLSRGHNIIPSAPLVPENDPTTLFTGSGMQPMVSYLLGQTHPLGTRLVDSQKCFRTQDIVEVGDNRHDTFFEMLGNWSLGDYFKKEQISWLFKFLTEPKAGLGLDPSRLYISAFAGNSDINIPRDEETVTFWQEQFSSVGIDALAVKDPEKGMQRGRIFYYDDTKNWWSRSGTPAQMPVGEPGGPDSEVFFDFGTHHQLHENSPFKNQPCHPNCDCGRFIELGNSVFMTYLKTNTGFVPLEKKNIDFGGGLERIAAAVLDTPDIYRTDLYSPIISRLEEITGKAYSQDEKAMRVIADHLKASVFLIVDGVRPGNKQQDYYLRRLLRRVAVKSYQLKGQIIDPSEFSSITDKVLDIYKNTSYFNSSNSLPQVNDVVREEMIKFTRSLDKGLKEFNKYSPVQLDAKTAFNLYQTLGFPVEIIEELYLQKNVKLDREEFDRIFKSHQDLSRTASAGMFKGGLADDSHTVVRYHTATHLLHQALRDVLGSHVQQKGSNITAERLRFDFSHPARLTPEETTKVELIINQKISENLTVTKMEMSKTQALSQGALAFFPEKYPDNTSVYKIGDYSMELCGGPHVNSTGELGRIKIVKEESAGSGIRRIYARLSDDKKIHNEH
ncbi:hypothetical protein A2395_02755 [Candidatus Amesbacteria bacterium RIFOXYB1_FULL_47_9]|uniref:alanine--tRNA ligase n=1 Tax=Candidatus Amesbacteria bacterium RIFOXYB1_FULL_47_9 TaxID=1797266 RepID=A0A1F4ZW58_9BACT|nr:MAG: hypothetical protein A2395_02755 [Candidatus Amesbacteria bacterium RIFOXYB1_FULL_47_9]